MDSIPLKRCGHCKKYKPASKEFFHAQKNGEYGLRPTCKACVKEYHQRPEVKEKARLRSQRPDVKAMMREYRASPRGQEVLKNYNDSEKAKKRMKAFYSTPEQKAKHKAYSDKEESKALRRIREQNPKLKAKTRAYQQSEKGKQIFKVHGQKRRTLKKALPNNFTVNDWQRALDYFHGCCAVCGRQLTDLLGTHTVAMDHWIPMSSPLCTGTIPTNIIPLCHGVDGCNNSKHNKLPEEWIEAKFGKRKAKVILNRINEYFKHLTLECVK